MVINLAYPACRPAGRDGTVAGGRAPCGGGQREAGVPAVRPSLSWSQGCCGLQAHPSHRSGRGLLAAGCWCLFALGIEKKV